MAGHEGKGGRENKRLLTEKGIAVAAAAIGTGSDRRRFNGAIKDRRVSTIRFVWTRTASEGRSRVAPNPFVAFTRRQLKC